jgi:hypothetical protein
MLEFLFSKHAPQKPFISVLSVKRGLPVIVKDEIYGAITHVIKQLL